MYFTSQLWATIKPIYTQIIQHPFIIELAEGTLSQEKFIFYLEQDALFLLDFARVLAIIGSRLPKQNHMLDFFGFARDIVTAERQLQDEYFSQYNVTRQLVKSPTCAAYTNLLLATVNLYSVEEAVAVVLPCFWIYQEVGYFLRNKSVPENPYQQWIDLYAGEEYSVSVRKVLQLTNELADQTTEQNRQLMSDQFIEASRLEWAFWHGSYQQETWDRLLNVSVAV